MKDDTYLTLAGEGHAHLREKASRFIAYAFPVRDEASFKERTAAIARSHHDARHFCYAWVLGANGGQHRSNDDGEPSGTAGRPILQRIQAAGLTQCAVVVVRYFGGTLLGKGGLVKAYGESAAMALADAPVEQVMVRDMVRVRCGYDRLETVRNTVVRLDGEVIDAHYDAACYLLVALPRSMVHGQIEAWLAAGLYARPEGAEK